MLAPRKARDLSALLHHQFGVADLAQLRAAGLTSSAVSRWVATGRLIRVYRGVYAVGHASLRTEARWMAVLLACGEDSWLSHGSAAAAFGWRAPGGSRIHVTTDRRTGRKPPRPILLHRVRHLPAAETTHVGALRVTSPARTLVDLAASLSHRKLEQIMYESVRHEHFDLRAVEAVIAAHPTRAGVPAVVKLLATARERGLAETRSRKEIAFLELCDLHRVPAPRTNVPLCDLTVDAHWPGTNIVVEIDSWSWHRDRRSFEEDRARDQRLTLAGYRVIRLTARQMDSAPERIAAMLRALLADSGSTRAR